MNGGRMKRHILASFLVAFLVCAFSLQASAYTLLWDDYRPGTGVVAEARQNPDHALHKTGEADDYGSPTISTSDFTSLGFGGSIVLYLANNEAIANIAGDDFTVFETTGSADTHDYNPNKYPEHAEIYAFTGGLYDNEQDYADSYWQSLGTILQNGSLDLGLLSFTTAIKIVDVTTAGPSTDGFDVYGLGVNQVMPVPVPAAVWMLGSGLIALLGIRRKMSV